MPLSRRQALAMIGGAIAAPSAFGLNRAIAQDRNTAQLLVQPARAEIMPGFITEGLVSTRPDGPPPVLRMRQGQAFTAHVTNNTEDYTAMHWHGLRIPNNMDGVPYLTQFPIAGGETFDYAYTPPDAGTHWYHPHCMTMEQMARGLTGVLIVEEPENPGFDSDISLNFKDFRLGHDGQFIDLWTARGAARTGTFGTVMTANWAVDMLYDAPAGGLVRLRVVATDTARIYRLFIPNAIGHVIALDGHPLATPVALPTREEDALILSAGQRADVALRMPDGEGEIVDVMTDAPGGPRRLARLRATGSSLHRSIAELKPLPSNAISEPDMPNARLEEFVFGWSPQGDAPNNGFCGTLGYTFWSINRKPWPGDAAIGTGPLATFKRGETAVLRLRNESPNAHPIHLHGLTFRVIASNQKAVSSHWTDTALLQKGETVDVAFVADNPGDWAFHCHVIEHQKTGLAGFIRVL